MQYLKFFSGLLLIAILSSSCAGVKANKRLNAHANLLNDTALSKMPTEKKLDILAGSFVQLMHQGMGFVNPKKGVKFVEQYGTQNKQSFDTIIKEMDAWQENMNTLEQLTFAARMIQKPYVKEFFQLIPKFKRKYQQVAFVNKMSKKLTGNLTKLGGNKLDKMLGL